MKLEHKQNLREYLAEIMSNLEVASDLIGDDDFASAVRLTTSSLVGLNNIRYRLKLAEEETAGGTA